jgi:IS1 family transposase
MNRLSLEDRARLIGLMVEGSSLRAATRLTGVSINTASKLLVDAGTACAKYQDETLRNLTCKRIQCDEIWAFCYAKQKNVPEEMRGTLGVGDVWTWVALDAQTKLVPCWLVGKRDAGYAFQFINDLKGRLANRVQLTTDGHRAYLSAVEDSFGADVDFGMLVKLYSETADGAGAERKYSPGICTHARKEPMIGDPDLKHISTSFVERQNLTMRMGMRRFTRLTNAFSKKFENHKHSVALHFMHYNFCRIHKSLRVTPAMEAGVSNHVWSLEEIAKLTT